MSWVRVPPGLLPQAGSSVAEQGTFNPRVVSSILTRLTLYAILCAMIEMQDTRPRPPSEQRRLGDRVRGVRPASEAGSGGFDSHIPHLVM